MTSDLSRQDDPRVERTRAAVIDAAYGLLMTEGPSAITHSNVAAAAGVSRTTVYAHWPTREDLLRATIDAVRSHKPRVDDLVGHLRVDLGTLFAPVASDLLDDQRAAAIATMMQRSLFDPEVVAVRDGFLTEFTDVLADVLARAVRSGELRPDTDVRGAITSILGSLLFRRFMSSEPFDASVVDEILDHFVRNHSAR
ncbi:MAG TPA: TetR/AcrR family transcriptional regulator [Ilumatobacteraceae bacterium]|nr:TetR/AcrR family transcriptional regulator [Ilumatobacteraceae bacterium]